MQAHEETAMPATFILTAHPAKRVKSAPGEPPTLIVKPFAEKLGLAVVTASSVEHIATAVDEFGKSVRQRAPEHSFYIAVRVRPGDKVPEGFDDAQRSNRFRQDAHTHVTDNGGPDWRDG